MILANKQEISAFNHPDTLLIISAYPKSTSLHTGGGLSSYTKYTVQSILKASPRQKIIVLANILDQKETYLENNVLVIRCWQRNSPFLIFQIFSQILKFFRPKNILTEFEFAAYGEVFVTLQIGLLISKLRLLGKNTTTVVHQVVTDLDDLATHTGLAQSHKQIKTYNIFLRLFYRLLALGSHHVITLENKLADRFNQITSTQKALAIPHGLFPQNRLKKSIAKKILGYRPQEIYVLAFGYLSHYKGSDVLVEAFQKPLVIKGKSVKLVLAGGESPTQGHKTHYHEFYRQLYEKIQDNPNIIRTGFIPDKRVRTIYSAADLIIFPYRAFMSASGPLALAIAYNRPFIASKKLNNYTEFSFTNNPIAIRNMLRRVFSHPDLYRKIVKQSKKMRHDRDFNLQGQIYLDILQK
jgi:glycosyltransferase involved in cell wall biosynthesis